MVPLGRNTGAMSALVYSAASAWLPANRRWTRRVSPSAVNSTSCTHGVCEIDLHPVSVSALALTAAPRRKLRRLSSAMCASNGFAPDEIASRDHRTNVVPRSGEHDHDHVDDEETQEREGADEMEGARALPPAEDPRQERQCGIHGG